MTSDSERAFLTIDSGFPLTELEQDLRKNIPFTYPFPISRVPVLLHETDWSGLGSDHARRNQNLVDVMLRDRFVARLYWASPNSTLKPGWPSPARLACPSCSPTVPCSIFTEPKSVSVPDTSWYRRDRCRGRVEEPGGSEPGVRRRLRAPPVGKRQRLARGILRRDSPCQSGTTGTPYGKLAPETSVRGLSITGSSGTRRQRRLRKAPSLLVLFTRLQWEPNGNPHVPGNLEVWKNLPRQRIDAKILRDWNKRARGWNRPDQLIEAMAAASRIPTDNGPCRSISRLASWTECVLRKGTCLRRPCDYWPKSIPNTAGGTRSSPSSPN